MAGNVSEPKREELVALTSMRGVAAVLVAIFHFNGMHEGTGLITRGYLWVDFFFMLSGFILAHVYGSMFRGGVSKAGYGDFLVKRLGRIYPLHLATLVVYVLLGLVVGLKKFDDEPYTILWHIFLVQAWGVEDHLTWNHVSWSISAEWGFYLVFPLIARWMLTARMGVIAAIAAVSYAVLVGLDLWRGSLLFAFDYALVRCLTEAIVGIALYRLFAMGPDSGIGRLARKPVVQWGTLIVPLVVLYLGVRDSLVVGTFVFMMLPLAFADGAFARIFAWRPIYHLGLVSYSLYMTHFVILVFARKAFLERSTLDPRTADLPLWLLLGEYAVFSVICAVAATVTYKLIEVPGRNWVRRLMTRAPRPRTERLPAPAATAAVKEPAS